MEENEEEAMSERSVRELGAVGRTRTEAELVVIGRNMMTLKIGELMDKATTTETEVGKLKDPAATVVNQERADAFANIAEDCYVYHRALILKWEELQETMIESIESLNKIPAHTVVGRKAASLIDKWEADLVKAEEKLQKVIDKIQKKFDKAVDDCDELGFRPEHTELYRMENAVEAEAKFLEAKQKLEKQGTDFVKKKIGSALISNKQVIIEDFDGEPENWDAFYETFRPIVEENTELLDVVKFALLKKACKGKAGDMIRMYSSADYFNEAMDRLRKVYDDKDNRFRMLWDRLENVRTAKETVSSMRRTINDVAAIVSALKKVSEIETPAVKVLVKRKFPRKILEELSRNKGDATTEDILHTIEETVKREELIENEMMKTRETNVTLYTPNQRDRSREYKRDDSRGRREWSRDKYRSREGRPYERKDRYYNDQRREYGSRDRNFNRSRERNERSRDRNFDNRRPRDELNKYRKSPHPGRRNAECLFCQRDNHASKDCNRVTGLDERKEVFWKEKLCFNCGRRNHAIGNCSSEGCYTCNKKHHSSICPKKNYNGKRTSRSEDRSRDNSRNRQSSGDRSRQSSGDRSRRSSGDRSRQSSGDRSRNSSWNRRDNSRDRKDDYSRDRRSESRDRYRSNNRSYGGKSYRRVNMARTGETNLMIAPARVQGPISREKDWPTVETLVILDSGAEQNYVEEGLAEYIGAEVVEKNKDLTVVTVGGEETNIRSDKVRLEILTQDGKIKIEALTIPRITNEFDPIQVESRERAFIRKHNIKYQRPEGTQAGLLLGVDAFMKIMGNMEKTKLPTGRSIIYTKLGNIICGSRNERENGEIENIFVAREDDNKETIGPELTLEEHFSLQNIGIVENPVDPKIEEIKQMFYDTVIIDEEKRVSVTFPFKKDMILKLADNYKMALARLRAMHRNSRNTEAWNKLIKNFEDMIGRKILEDTGTNAVDEENRPVYYIPYQLVYNENSNTTKVRTVFDASSAVKGEISLNQAVHQGPSLVPELLGILLRIRTHRYILVGDIEKAFHMVGLQEIHRDSTRFLYLKDPLGDITEENLRVMRFTRIPFGVNASPYLLAMAIEFGIGNSEASPKLKEVVKRMCYVDNLFGTSNSEEELIELYRESKVVFNNTGMNIREFSLNSPLESSIDKKDRIEEGQSTKLLGYLFDGKSDTMSVKKTKLSPSKKVTKREVVKVVSSTYDPLQIFAPVYLDGKKLIREVSGKNLKWNEEVQRETVGKLQAYIGKIDACEFSFIRFLGIPEKQECTLAIFSDASKDVYGACAYVNWQEQREIKTVLVMAKQRLAPSGHTVTIPRLELVGIVLSARIAKYLVNELDIEITTIGIYSDSTIALSQIKSFKKDSVFIENRRNEILGTLEELRYDEVMKRFREVFLAHVETKDNTADLITRGIESVEELLKTNWFGGPDCINGKSTSASEKFYIQKLEGNTNIVLLGTTKQQKRKVEDIGILPDEHRLHFDRSCRMVSYVLRFIIRSSKEVTTISKGYLTPEEVKAIESAKDKESVNTTEMKCAEDFLIREHQEMYGIKEAGKLNQHRNKTTGIVEQHFRAATMKPKPIINPKSILGSSIIDKIHKESYHCGVNTTIGMIRTKYAGSKWRAAVKNRLKTCVKCRKFNNHPFPVAATGNLPDRRITLEIAFQHAGVDYAGPFMVIPTGSRSFTKVKAWIAVITCMTSRLVHLEIVYSLTTDEFLMALARFMARRGVPETITSDNATTFKAAAEVATNVYKIEKVLANKRIKWYFNTAAAPWEGGVWEKMVGLVKKALKHAISDQALSHKDFETIVVECEGIVNHRPLTYIDEEEGEALRPIDLITPKIVSPLYNEKTLEGEYPEFTYRFREVQKHVKRFWEVFTRDYQNQNRIFESVQFKNKAHSNKVSPIVGEIVLIKSDQKPRNQWKLARITKLCPGKDGVVRTVELRTDTKRLKKRRIEQLIPLEIRPNSEVEQVFEENVETKQRKRVRFADEEKKTKEQPAIVERMKTRSQTRREKELGSRNFLSNVETKRQTPVYKPTSLYKQAGIMAIMVLMFMMMITGVTGALKLEKLVSGSYNSTGEKLRIEWETTTTTTTPSTTTTSPNRERINPTELRTTPRTSTTNRIPSTTERPTTTTTKTKVEAERKPATTTGKPKVMATKPTTTTTRSPQQKEDKLKEKPPRTTPRTEEKKRETDATIKREANPEQEPVNNKQDETVKKKPWAVHNSESYITCTESGVQLIDKEIVMGKTYDVCTGTYCINEIETRSQTDITFPAKEVVNKHKITWKKPLGDQFVLIDKVCPPTNYCAKIDCTFCFQYLLNTHCAPGTLLALVTMLLIIPLKICISWYQRKKIRALVTALWLRSKRITMGIWNMGQNVVQKRTRRGRNRDNQRGSDQENPEEIEMREIRRERQTEPRSREDRQRIERLPVAGTRGRGLALTAIALILCNTVGADVCDLTIPITHTEKICNDTKCQIVTTEDIFFNPTQTTVCLQLVSEENVISKLKIKAEYVYRRCQKSDIRYTRNTTVKVDSAKRCYGMGECIGRKCLDIGPQSKLSEFKEANKYEGRTYCTDSCGTFFCECLFPMEACLFYRTYAAPNTEDVFEKFKCEEWGHQLVVTTTITTNGYERSEEHVLAEGEVETMQLTGGEVSVELTGIGDESGLAIMGKTFLQKDDKIAVASEAVEDLALECDEEQRCHYKETCICTAGGDEANCQCKEVDLYKILEHKDYMLPIITEKYQLAATRDRTPVLRMKHNQVHLKVYFNQKYDIALTKSEVDCEIMEYSEFEGCYHCNQGAKQTVKCKSKEPTHAKLSCNDTEFIDVLSCNNEGVVNEIHRKFDIAHPVDVCSVKCGKKRMEKGTVATLEELLKQLGDAGNRAIIYAPTINNYYCAGNCKGGKGEVKDDNNEETKEVTQEEPKEVTQEEPKKVTQEEPKKVAQEETKEHIKEDIKNKAKEGIKEDIKDKTKEDTKEDTRKETAQEGQEENRREPSRAETTPEPESDMEERRGEERRMQEEWGHQELANRRQQDQGGIRCKLCNGLGHMGRSCFAFSCQERRRMIRNRNLCQICLNPRNHSEQDCRVNQTYKHHQICYECEEIHSKNLCFKVEKRMRFEEGIRRQQDEENWQKIQQRQQEKAVWYQEMRDQEMRKQEENQRKEQEKEEEPEKGGQITRRRKLAGRDKEPIEEKGEPESHQTKPSRREEGPTSHQHTNMAMMFWKSREKMDSGRDGTYP
ncbi:hypothetical protein B9Z55_007751 [Caenorhabditis nigoni]|uniref:Integrase catalytic domain-containing protein n=1 Tax=Caenorhabditis nigoni TaxID=1611254 RepID=A0A2G5VBQ8_9PELO|nr:hypothetical protein B9Z55_007751 [Caenorhabditis nigoni]